jgi:hypothetical protein
LEAEKDVSLLKNVKEVNIEEKFSAEKISVNLKFKIYFPDKIEKKMMQRITSTNYQFFIRLVKGKRKVRT